MEPGEAEADCANPQLLAWVKEWLDIARERNSKGVTVYKNAYESLRACPLVFEHPSQLQQLKGFGPKLCERLTENLKKHCQQNGLPMPEYPQAKRAEADTQDGADGAGAKKKSKARAKPYVPTFRSGAYALVLGLSTLPENATRGLTKADLIQVSQPHCDASLSVPSDPTKFYTAWNSMKTLVQKELVYESGRPLRRYALSDEGWDVVRRIKETRQWQTENEQPADGAQSTLTTADSLAISRRPPSADALAPQRPASPPLPAVAQDTAASSGDTLSDFDPIKLPPGSFSVHLLLDVREVRSKTDRDYMQEELAKQDVKPIMRSLEVGDAQWIAKCHDPDLLPRHGIEGDEVALDWIVERKRLDDLISSIKDGRFHEQKFRLTRSGATRVVYIIEEISMDPASYQRYEESVLSAIASTQVVNGFFVKRTAKMDETVKYLAKLTQMLKSDYESKTLNVIPTRVLTPHNYLPLLKQARERDSASVSSGYYVSYSAFAALASKSDMMTLRDVFLKMLMTTRGVTGERALELQKRWRTPYELVKAFETCGSSEAGMKRKRELVADEMLHLIGRKKFSKAMSEKIAQVWGDA